MRSQVTGVSQEVSQHLGAIATRFSETSEDVRAQAARAAASLQREQERIRADAEKLPTATRESAEAMRMALNEQLRALEQLSALASRERRDVVPPLPIGREPPAPPSLTAAYSAQVERSATLAAASAAGDGPERWSLGDLLARASLDEDGRDRGLVIDLENIARALDPAAASAIWSRFRAGQRGIMVRSIYTAEGRVTFDEVTERYAHDMDFRRTADRFLADFERMMRDVEARNPRAVHDQLVSDAGRVYLFLAHASGRLR